MVPVHEASAGTRQMPSARDTVVIIHGGRPPGVAIDPSARSGEKPRRSPRQRWHFGRIKDTRHPTVVVRSRVSPEESKHASHNIQHMVYPHTCVYIVLRSHHWLQTLACIINNGV